MSTQKADTVPSKETKFIALPVRAGDYGDDIVDSRDNPLATLYGDEREPETAAQRDYIVRAVNSFDDMLAALKDAELHIAELREAWQRGAISEHDGQGGTRSNRNVDVHIEIRDAIAKAETK